MVQVGKQTLYCAVCREAMNPDSVGRVANLYCAECREAMNPDSVGRVANLMLKVGKQ